MKIKKHAIEGLLELISSDPYIFKPGELYELNKTYCDFLLNHNLYLVTRRNRISFEPNSLKISDCGNIISGAFSVQEQDTTKSRAFKCILPREANALKLCEMKYPYNILSFELENFNEPQYIRLQDVITHSTHELDNLENLKVEYIGQSYGDNGSSNAMNRLIGNTGKQGHGALQRILAEINNSFPDQEVFILLYDYLEYKNFIYAGGALKPTFNFESNENRLFDLLEAKYSRKNRIDLVEAALIRYFEPTYNDIFKKTFPRKTHEMLESLFKLDVTGLAVTISTMDHKIKIFSDKVDPSDIHCAKYSIVNESDRASFLDLTTNRTAL